MICIMLVGLIGFGLGRLSSKYQAAELNINSTLVNTADLDKIITAKPNTDGSKPIFQNTSPSRVIESVSTNAINTSRAVVVQKVVGNKQSKLYHLENCPGALKMKEENKVFFTSVVEAQQAGYKPAGNCPGLK